MHARTELQIYHLRINFINCQYSYLIVISKITFILALEGNTNKKPPEVTPPVLVQIYPLPCLCAFVQIVLFVFFPPLSPRERSDALYAHSLNVASMKTFLDLCFSHHQVWCVFSELAFLYALFA